MKPGLDEKVLVPRARQREGALAARLQQIREELELPESFPAEVEREAREVVASVDPPGLDLTDVPFVTIDPPGATDLDQALHIERNERGYLVQYAIADVPAFVPPGGAIDAEARERGQTLYAPDGRIPLHPAEISEDAASLLADRVRGAFVWTFQLDQDGEVTSTALQRARVRSVAQLTYEEAQALADSGDPLLGLLRAVGMLRLEVERARGGASLNRPDEEVEVHDGRYTLAQRAPLPVEQWNAQLSLMTGMAAARIMLDGGVGILRTMPVPSPETIDRFRRQVAALGCPWPEGLAYGEFLRALDVSSPSGLAAVHAAAALFRGAGYTAFDGELPEETIQAAVAAPYAHATAPLRRLVDRFVLVTCEALLVGNPVPEWVRDALPTLPKIVGRTGSTASRLERESVAAIEAALLQAHIGAEFEAVVIAARGSSITVQVVPPADGTLDAAGIVTASVEATATPGDTVRVRLVAADIPTGTVTFALA